MSKKNIRQFTGNTHQPNEIDYNELIPSRGWHLAPDSEKIFHAQGLPTRLVEKWVNDDGREYVFVGGAKDGSGKLLLINNINSGS